ncbi:M14 family zinc carboxypeptidase [Alteromonas sp. H39]|uniref:M14 family zinc carboxypeptidase n=1 Tax=Alteromonas sp. H39 TaxID=3389876 RepID=UPI0039E035D7
MTEQSTSALLLKRIAAYQWAVLDKPHLTYSDISPLLRELAVRERITLTRIGNSFQGLPIHRLTIGNGPLTFLAWTQMHGDEPTATAAMLDLLAMLSEPACDDIICDNWLSQVTLHIIVMLNPDGASLTRRENAQGIDINRDARALQTPEGRLLDEQVRELRPDIGFNLHDQSRYYAVGSSKKPATLSFLAPPFNAAGDVDGSRLRAKQLIAAMHQAVSNHRPGQFGRYNDAYAHRCFGDTIAGCGVSTILIESGADYHDPNRQSARTLNVVALYTALNASISQRYLQYSLDDYYAIAENQENGLCDVLLKNVTQENETGDRYRCDIAVNETAPGHATVVATGDLTELGGFREIDCDGLTLCNAKGFCAEPGDSVTGTAYLGLLSQGYNHLLCQNSRINIATDLPLLQCLSPLPERTGPLPGTPAFFVFRDDKKPCCALLSTHWLTF